MQIVFTSIKGLYVVVHLLQSDIDSKLMGYE